MKLKLMQLIFSLYIPHLLNIRDLLFSVLLMITAPIQTVILLASMRQAFLEQVIALIFPAPDF